MRVILLEKVANLGSVGELHEVKPGYARNYLIPYGKAVFATEENIRVCEERRAELEQKAAEALDKAKQRAEALADLTVEMTVRSSDEGKLYGSIGTRELVDAIKAQKVDCEKREISLPSGPLRYLGEHTIELRLHSDVTAKVKVTLLPDQALAS